MAKNRKEMIFKRNENVELSEKPDIPELKRVRRPLSPNSPINRPGKYGAK